MSVVPSKGERGGNKRDHAKDHRWSVCCEQWFGRWLFGKGNENALAHELRKIDLQVSQQHRVPVLYDGVVVGDYVADLLVENCVLVELKAVKELDNIHQAQCINYLKATGLKVCLLLNFGKPRVQVKRIVL